MAAGQLNRLGQGAMRSMHLLPFVLLFVPTGIANAQKVIRLYDGAAPGSEKWTHQEKEYYSTVWNTQVVTNVWQPTLTVYSPDPAKATGTALIICPGGAFHALSITSEGVEVAKWLAGRGITAFVLKYRLVPTGEDATKELIAKMADRKRGISQQEAPLFHRILAKCFLNKRMSMF